MYDITKRTEQIKEFLVSMYTKKNADYGNSFTKNYREYGVTSAMIRLDDKINRISKLAKKNNNQVADESMRDTLLDAASYAIMTMMEVEGKTDINPAEMPNVFLETLDIFLEASEFCTDNYKDGFHAMYEKYGMTFIQINLDQQMFIFKGNAKNGFFEKVCGDLWGLASDCILTIFEIDMATEKIEEQDIRIWNRQSTGVQ
jgi:hypothetical protein